MTTTDRLFTVLVFAIAVVGLSARPYLQHGRPHGGLKNHGLGAASAGLQVAPTQYFTQRVDHYNPQDTSTFQQRYWVNSTNFRNSTNGISPVFIMLGGEGEENPLWVAQGFMVEQARKYNALCILVEHRFYGASQPFQDLSTEHLALLSSQQALADFASFVSAMKVQWNLSDDLNPWVVFGGSYSGAMAAWFRLKYPQLVVGAVAASAPVLAETNFSQYFEVVSQSLKWTKNGDQCNTRVGTATKTITNMLLTPGGRSQLGTLFSICNNGLANPSNDDTYNFMASLAGNFAGVVQYTFDNNKAGQEFTVDWLCETMNTGGDDTDNLLKQYAAINSALLKSAGNNCLDINYTSSIVNLTNSTIVVEKGDRQWFYQTCTEFGYFQSSDSTAQPFGNMFPGPFWTQQCNQVFGDMGDLSEFPNVPWTNSYYGGRNVTSSNIVFPNGGLDPWKALSILHDVSSSEPLVLVPGTAHCSAIYPSSSKDSQDLIDARNTISDLLGTWISASESPASHLTTLEIVLISLASVLGAVVATMAVYAFFVTRQPQRSDASLSVNSYVPMNSAL
eukprot:gnl/Spiro4/16026_TR8617_c0_g1_i1.p1 gnl/Spiro4/16026_TR8617_c0_g1~~gnl/Spiro4/16026_TR8617_c0_g1_i1.p1  ORF type:complete len:582 (+),score=119.29 gnl/Spiro4/16026_TR8617_c0_g1_i1:62-1747(+)